MVKTSEILAIATAIVVLSAFSFSAPLLRAASALTPIPSPASCQYAGHPLEPLSQTTVAVGSFTVTKHAEKEFYDCIISGTTTHYILDTTTWTTIRENVTGAEPNPTTVSNGFVECAKDKAHATVYSCQTEAVGSSLATTNGCTQLPLAYPQWMDTVVVNGLAKTVESQKELFRCATPNGPVIQELVIWTFILDDPTGTTASSYAYAIETCQKPVTITTGLPLLSCAVTGPVPLIH